MSEQAHICRTMTFRAGIDLPPMACPYCAHITLYPTWVTLYCTTCGFDSEHYTVDNIRIVRQNMGLTRKQIAKALGYKPSTVKHYEFVETSRVYWHKFKAYVAQHYNHSGTIQELNGN